ncbi:SAC3 domain-containing protein 1 [Danio rerio]|uniref:SAC3 domain-containing protein 1 n=1 Tax=Danio rerio TaxID=7955 RepID=A0AB13A8D7_DANRE|nr:SAC3 domain-containing protein 1 [Danio rerio]
MSIAWSHSRRGRGPRQKEQTGVIQDQKAEASVPHGSCMTMCPAYELRQREAQSRLHRFEMLPGTEQDRLPRADISRAVKEYSRPAAGKDSTRASDLRPPSVLLKTVSYLVDEVATSSTFQPWTEVYSFVFDRLRSVRQDMIIQRVSGPDCVAVLEKSVRFLLYSSYRLCGQPLQLYDPRINDTHLQESLSWLLESYSEGKHQHQEEFQALALLYNLGSAQAVQHVLALPERIRSSLAVRLALEVSRAHMERNPVRLLRLAKKLDFMQVCAVHRHLLPCRRDLLLLYSHGHSSRNYRYPLQRLAQLLCLKEALAVELCTVYSVKVTGDCVNFSKSSFTEASSADLQCRHMHEPLDHEHWNGSSGSLIHSCA